MQYIELRNDQTAATLDAAGSDAEAKMTRIYDAYVGHEGTRVQAKRAARKVAAEELPGLHIVFLRDFGNRVSLELRTGEFTQVAAARLSEV